MTTAATIAQQVRDGIRSAQDVLHEAQARIGALDPGLNCFRGQFPERAAREAEAIDARRRRGEALPPLAGVPYAVKDLFDVAGTVTLAGSTVNADNAPARSDAAVIERLRAAGAVLLGTLNMDEHAYGFTTENSHYGPTRNPHDPSRVAGGSSGGSAAAVAAGLVTLSLGSDTNGSIRVPASLCGIYGLKPTYGRLSRRGVFPFVHSLDHVGHFAASVDDLALAYDLMQGADPDDPACAQRPTEPLAGRLQLPAGLRVAVLGGWFEDWAGAQAHAAVARVAAALGARRTLIWAGAEAARSAAFIVTAAEGGALHAPRLHTRYADFEPLSRDRLIAGNLIPAHWLSEAQLRRRVAAEQMQALFADVDLLLAPATPVCAPPIGSETLELGGRSLPARASLGLLTQPISCVGLPVCTVPLWPAQGSDATAPAAPRLPIGVQIIAAPWREDLCLAAAHALERDGICTARAAP